MTTDPCKMTAICEAAMEWYEARQAVIDTDWGKGVTVKYTEWTEAEKKLVETIECLSKGR